MDLDLFCRKFLVVRSVDGNLASTVEMIKEFLGPIELEADYVFE